MNFWHFLSNVWLLVLLDQHLLSSWVILFFFLLKDKIFIHKSANTWEINVLVHFKLLKRLAWNLIGLSYLLDVDYFTMCSIVICFPKHIVLHLCFINLPKLKETTMYMQSIIYWMIKLIISQIAVVFIFNFWHSFFDIISFSECYLNKLMIANNSMCSSLQMFGHNSPKHKLMFNLKLDIMHARDVNLNKWYYLW